MSGAPVIDPARVGKVLARHPQQPSAVVDLLHDIQEQFRYLPEQAMRQAAGHLGISEARLYSLATFFEGFHLKPRGEHVCTVCMGTACHVRGAPRLLDQLERDLGIAPGQTTPDLQFTLQEVNCVGACALGPLVIVDGDYHGSMNSARLTKLVTRLKKQG